MQRVNDRTLKIYEITLFITWLSFLILQIVTSYFQIFEIINGIGFIILIAMFISWAVLIGNKNLSKFELILAFGFIGYVFLFLAGIILSYLGFIGWYFFGMYTEQFLALIILVLFIISILFSSYRLIKNQKRKKIAVTRSDLFIILFFILIVLVITIFYILL